MYISEKQFIYSLFFLFKVLLLVYSVSSEHARFFIQTLFENNYFPSFPFEYFLFEYFEYYEYYCMLLQIHV